MITPGSRVAYNYSGDVATGVVEKITSGGEFHILRDEEFHGTNPISKVKRAGSVLVIHESESIRKQIIERRDRMEADYDLRLSYAVSKLEAREKKIQEKTTALIETVRDAWDVDEVKMKLVELFGEDVFKEEEDIPDWLLDVSSNS